VEKIAVMLEAFVNRPQNLHARPLLYDSDLHFRPLCKFAAYASEVARQGYASGEKLVNGVDGSGKMERQFNRKPFGGHMT
jgi:hypothetical protein